ncbi:cilia- and flagella-associated protein 43-like [Macrotis lagotis]|uniref:cilia- and flagella-associated protein 43-like n=1 Tax=Macrotis lagotis TaxID=92651 RepID=UPI003D690F89
MVFSYDGKSIIVNGKEDGAFVCLKWKSLSGPLVHKVTEYFQMSLPFLENNILEQNLYIIHLKDTKIFSESLPEYTESYKKLLPFQIDASNSVFEDEPSWLQKKNQEAIKKEIKIFSGKKEKIKEGIKTLSKTIQHMMEENELASEITQLEQQEFNLDIEEMERIHDEGEEELENVCENLLEASLFIIFIDQKGAKWQLFQYS